MHSDDLLDTLHTKLGAVRSWQDDLDAILSAVWHEISPTLAQHAPAKRVAAAKQIARIRTLAKVSWKAAHEGQALIEIEQEGVSEINADLDDMPAWDADAHRVHELLCQAGLR